METEVHKGLVKALENLQQVAKGDFKVLGVSGSPNKFFPSRLIIQVPKRVWRDVPLLSMCMEYSFNGTFVKPLPETSSLISQKRSDLRTI